MDVMEAITGRRSIRKFKKDDIEPEKLEKVLEAGRLAPSAGNGQTWKFIVVRDETVRKSLQELTITKHCLENAPVIIVACGLNRDVMTCGHRVDTVDVSIAMSYMLLEAHEQGLGTCWMACYDENQVKELLGIPESASVVMITPLGYADESPEQRPRKTFEQVICYDRFE